MRRAIVTVGALVLSACIGSSTPHLRATPEVQTSEFEPTIAIRGVEQAIGSDRLSRYFIRSWIDKSSGGVEHQLYVSLYHSGDGQFYQSANGEDAQPMWFSHISQDVGSCYGDCSLWEDFGVALPDSLLKAHQPNGYSVKFYAKSGTPLVVSITPQQIAAQFGAIDQARPAVARAARQPKSE